MATINTDIAQKIDLVIRENNSASINLSIKDSNSNAFDLTGYTVKLNVYNGNETLFDHASTGSGSTISFSTPTNGLVSIFLTSAESSMLPGSYKYTVILEKGTSVKTWMYGKFKVNEN
tara:strand:+ start:215 stop:568 length:354 start_codon:yes stop_codon:yes gene_type:complete